VSRGPGDFQRRVLWVLDNYRQRRKQIDWRWQGGGLDRPLESARYTLHNLAWEENIESYEWGLRIPVALLLRDLDCTRPELSRALRSLYRQEMVQLYSGSLRFFEEEGRAVKFASIRKAGWTWLNRQQSRSGKVGTYSGGAADSVSVVDRRPGWMRPIIRWPEPTIRLRRSHA
jgi:hypothetical protein